MTLRRIALCLCLTLLLVAGGTASAAAATTSTSKSADSTKATTKSTATTDDGATVTGNGSVQGYAADTVLQDGTIVELVKGNNRKVEPATAKNVQQMYGVTVDPHLLSLTITDASLKNEVFVATSGTFEVLVSTQGGSIKPGDYITMSSVDGVGMNAGSDGTTVFGRAVGGFDGKTNTLGSTELKDSGGHVIKTATLGIIPVAVNIQRNPNEKSTKANLPQQLQRVGEAVAEKPVGGVRIYLSAAITFLSVIVAIVILYAGIRNSIIAIGRNPLSKKTVIRGLLSVIMAGVIVLIIGLFAVYLLLKL